MGKPIRALLAMMIGASMALPAWPGDDGRPDSTDQRRPGSTDEQRMPRKVRAPPKETIDKRDDVGREPSRDLSTGEVKAAGARDRERAKAQ